MKYMLVLFIASATSGVEPTIIEEIYPSYLSCWNAGLALKTRRPKTVVWWNCERMQLAEETK